MVNRLLTITTISAALVGASLMQAGADGHTPFDQRKAAMKTVGQSTKTIGTMLKGETEFDAAAANEAMVAMQTAVADYGDYFPEGSGGGESKAAPEIWSDREGFDTVLAAFKEDIDAGVAAAPDTKEGVAAAFGAIAENCKTCHEKYRLPDD